MEMHFAIDTQGKLSPGIYLVVGSSNEKIYKKKLIISENGTSGTGDPYISVSRW